MFKIKKLFFFISVIILIFFSYKYFNQETKIKKNIDQTQKNNIDDSYLSNSNIILDVKYLAQDNKGNKYSIVAKKGQIDLTNSNIIFLTDVIAIIELSKSDVIKITSNFGKYNTNNYDTIFSKNVIINYANNKIISEYLDFSLAKDLMIISKNVNYTNNENILKADTIEMIVSTKDTKIYMHENNKKVNLKNKWQ